MGTMNGPFPSLRSRVNSRLRANGVLRQSFREGKLADLYPLGNAVWVSLYHCSLLPRRLGAVFSLLCPIYRGLYLSLNREGLFVQGAYGYPPRRIVQSYLGLTIGGTHWQISGTSAVVLKWYQGPFRAVTPLSARWRAFSGFLPRR